MATTIKEFQAMGVDTDSKDFKSGYDYARKPGNVEAFKATVAFIHEWAKMQKRA